MLAPEIARVCHEANRGLQALQPKSGVAVSPAWDDDTDEQRASVIAGVEAAQAGATLAELHEQWCERKEDEGWVWGPVKDAEQKTHPCLVTYNLLPADQQAKDRLFSAIVGALSAPDEPAQSTGPGSGLAGAHQVVVRGSWSGDDPREVFLDGVPLRKVANVSVNEELEHRPWQLVVISLLTDQATVLPTGVPE